MDRIIVCDSKKEAYAVSKQVMDEIHVENRSSPDDISITTHMFSVYENILSGEFGLFVKDRNWEALKDKYKSSRRLHRHSQIWVNETFINGDPKGVIGSGPYGFGISFFNPKKYRSELQGKHHSELIYDIREKTRKYSTSVHNMAKDFIHKMKSDPSLSKTMLEKIDPNHFEEIVAELLVSMGFDVFITQMTRDGGKDIIAAYNDNDGEHLMMVDCKRYNNTVGVGTVAAVLGWLTHYKTGPTGISSGMLVTSFEKFSPDAIKMADKQADLSLKNHNDLCDWIQQYGEIRNGLWMPKSFTDIFN